MPQALKHWKCESCCFASAGLGRCHEITTTDHRRNGLLLNRRGVDIALVPERLEQWLSQPQVIESDLSIDRDSGLADRDGGESFTLEGSQHFTEHGDRDDQPESVQPMNLIMKIFRQE